MSTHDNLPALEGWELPPRCCGTWATRTHCEICGELVSPLLPDSIILGEN